MNADAVELTGLIVWVPTNSKEVARRIEIVAVPT
jgi:hypothetical protein